MSNSQSISRYVAMLASNVASVTVFGGALLLLPFLVSAQTAKDRAWSVPRTSAGHPVLQGHWTNSTVIPLQRPTELGDKAFYTDAEVAEFTRGRLEVNETVPGTAADVHYQLDDFGLGRSQNAVVANKRTSLIVDPPNGRFPEPTDAARALQAADREYRSEHGFDSAQDRALAERCIVWSNEGPPMLPAGYNSNYHIVQTADFVVVLMEMIHDARVIPVHDRAALPAGIGQWLGDSHGHWDGDTLVVETSNFTGETAVRAAGNIRVSKNSRVTERFTRTGPETILYEFTVEDPQAWTQPWSGEYPMTSVDGPMFEYACHEGNYGLANNLSGARADERRAAEAAR